MRTIYIGAAILAALSGAQALLLAFLLLGSEQSLAQGKWIQAPSAGEAPQSSPTLPSYDNKIPVADADTLVRLINNQYGAICSVTLEGWISKR
jgi:hypothetical protein